MCIKVLRSALTPSTVAKCHGCVVAYFPTSSNTCPSFAHAVWALAIFDGRHICIATVAIGRQERTIKFNESGKNLSIDTPLVSVKVICCLNNHLENLSSLMRTYSKLKYWKAQIYIERWYWTNILNIHKLTTNYDMTVISHDRRTCYKAALHDASVNIMGLDVNLKSLFFPPRPALKWNVVETSCQKHVGEQWQVCFLDDALKLPGLSAESGVVTDDKQNSFT